MLLACAILLSSILTVYITINSTPKLITGYASSGGNLSLSIECNVEINFITRSINFGSGRVNTGKTAAYLDTKTGTIKDGNWTANSAGIVLENIGNINVSINLKAGKTAAQFIGGTNPAYKYLVEDIEAGSCTSLSPSVFTDVNTTGIGTEICNNLNYLNSRDSIRIHLNITVPYNSFKGVLSDTLTATATAGSGSCDAGGGGESSIYYNLSYFAGAGGSLIGNVSQRILKGRNGTEVTAVPDVDYVFVNWSDGVLTEARTDRNVSGNINVTANFETDGGGGGDILGACCWEGSCYADMTEGDCSAGTWQGEFSTCDPDPCAAPPTACTCVIGQMWDCKSSECGGWQYDSNFLYGCLDYDGNQNLCGALGPYTPGESGCGFGGTCWNIGSVSDMDACNDDCSSLWGLGLPCPPSAECPKACGPCCTPDPNGGCTDDGNCVDNGGTLYGSTALCMAGCSYYP